MFSSSSFVSLYPYHYRKKQTNKQTVQWTADTFFKRQELESFHVLVVAVIVSSLGLHSSSPSSLGSGRIFSRSIKLEEILWLEMPFVPQIHKVEGQQQVTHSSCQKGSTVQHSFRKGQILKVSPYGLSWEILSAAKIWNWICHWWLGFACPCYNGLQCPITSCAGGWMW